MQYKPWHFFRYIRNHYHRIAYFLVAVLVIVMIAAIKEFINFATIEQNTQAEVLEQEFRKEKISFEQDFLIPYLSSETSKFFFLHENGVLFPNEYFVVFSDEKEEDAPDLEEGHAADDETNIEESESWQKYVDQLFNEIN